MIFPALLALVVGAGMIGQWSVSFFSKQIPELRTERIRILFHIAGEMATAILLIMSGAGLLAEAGWARTLFFVSMGMLFYTAIVSPGYFAQQGKWVWVVIFGAIIALGIAAIIAVVLR